ncbi:MAG: tRNA lysidine(34) synthetase TilS [Pseudomonadota bacterium]
MESASGPVVTVDSDPLRLLGLGLIPQGSHVTVAVSGGGDSMAMLHALRPWAKANHTQLTALSVDHRLRKESADEAAFVAAVCKEHSLDHKTLTWDNPKRSQNLARQARHRLLAKAAFDLKSNYLFMGHTLSDVLETYVMREMRESEPSKAVGPMPVSISPVWPEGRGLLILRPLLFQTRSVLREWLRGKGYTWVEDPTNTDERYERPRIRKSLSHDQGFATEPILNALERRASNEAPMATILRVCAETCDPYGLIRTPATSPKSLLAELFSILIPAAAGTDRIPKAHARKDAASMLKTEKGHRLTLGGAWLQRSADEILIGRDPANVDHTCQSQVFDSRFERSDATLLPKETPPFLVRHAVPQGTHWRCLIADRLNLHAQALEANAAILTKRHATVPS